MYSKKRSANGRFVFCMVSVSKGFQSDDRAERVKRTLGSTLFFTTFNRDHSVGVHIK
jgi:hypothetical protein